MLLKVDATIENARGLRDFSTGYLPGAHDETCQVYARILPPGLPWLESTRT